MPTGPLISRRWVGQLFLRPNNPVTGGCLCQYTRVRSFERQRPCRANAFSSIGVYDRDKRLDATSSKKHRRSYCLRDPPRRDRGIGQGCTRGEKEQDAIMMLKVSAAADAL